MSRGPAVQELDASPAIVQMVGQGGMGRVSKAFDEELFTRVALKVIRPEIAGSHGSIRYQLSLRLLLREIL